MIERLGEGAHIVDRLLGKSEREGRGLIHRGAASTLRRNTVALATKDVTTVTDPYGRRLAGQFEEVRTLLQLAPEIQIRVAGIARHVGFGHLEGESLNLKFALTATEGIACKGIDFADIFIGHGVAARRGAVAMHHKVLARAAVSAVELVRIADIESKIILAVRVHLVRADRIEALGGLAVAFDKFRAELAGIFADRVAFDEGEAAVGLLLPDLQRTLFLVEPNEDGRGLAHTHRLYLADEFGRKRFFRLRNLVERVGAGGQSKGRGNQKQNGERAKHGFRKHWCDTP
ncbi:hypothetical protein D8780_10910 [Notoacmeibacter ruber]|uniref:Uncharacterized protein n=1 Tax=Notoacmeibacter ruber TaxID=2670375 RepID=A0A3L7JD91_9HYPH|nr:hypothetical protein D8780_10910 [Notoacmeibacter ruber]